MRYCKLHLVRGSTAITIGFHVHEQLDDEELFDPEDGEQGRGDGVNKQQRIVVWVVASILSVVSIVNGFLGCISRVSFLGGKPDEVSLCWNRNSLFWFFLPVLFGGVAAFLHFMRRKD
jgi:hypothetical protein